MPPYLAVVVVNPNAGETPAERLDKLLGLWREGLQNVTFNPSELAFAAVLLGRHEDFLAAADAARPTRWLDAACAFARGDCVQAAELFSEVRNADR